MVLKFYGNPPPDIVQNIHLGGVCPACKVATRFTLVVQPDVVRLEREKMTKFIASYSCDNCLEPIPVLWQIKEWMPGNPVVVDPQVISPSRDPFDFDHVPETVKREIDEALDCLSVNAWNGFAAVCRRAIQAICVNLGANASTKVQAQIEEMIEATGLGDEWKELAVQIMLSGHDGSHPHLPDVSAERAVILLSLLKDLCYQLYTRPGKIREAAQLRKGAIEARKSSAP
jgi:hypothetical protein